MSEAPQCPHCGGPLDDVPGLEVPERTASTDSAPRSDAQAAEVAPATLLAPGSNDDSFLATPYGQRLAASEPDPILGPFVTPPPADPDSPEPSTASRAASVLFPSLDLSANSSGDGPESSSVDDDPAPRRTPWATVLLASYASALTLAFAWSWVVKGRSGAALRPEPPAGASAPNRDWSGRQSDLSRTVARPEPILGEHYVDLGRKSRFGDLEVTPLDINRRDVTLKHTGPSGQAETRDGGKGAFVLRLKLRNVSTDAVFAPLDQDYLREHGKDLVDTFIQASGGERIYPYKLAVESEWSIVGQDFTELRPGESREVIIVSAPDVPTDLPGLLNWRIRLRTGVDRTDVLGVRWLLKTPDPEPSPPASDPF